MSQKYRIKLHPKVLQEDSKQFNAKIKEKIKSKCLELLSESPDLVGEPLRRELAKYRKLKVFDDYRIIYRADPKERIVFILVVGIRRNEEVYKEAMRRA